MKKYPKSIDVYGSKIEIEQAVDPIIYEGRLCDGLYELDNNRIIIDKNLETTARLQTFLHELVHALSHRLGWRHGGLTIEMEELIAENIPTLLVERFDMKFKKT